MSDRVCRWGIMSTAEISKKNWLAIRNASNATVAAVASRTVDRSEQYISECQPAVPHDPRPAALGSYEELLARDDIDAVYIPLPTGIRKEWIIKAAEAGKHVLAEKPSGNNAADVREMIDACAQNNVQYMDGVMFMHSDRFRQMREVLDDGESVGNVKRIVSHHCFAGPEDFIKNNIRLSSELEPLGAMGDVGWYNIRFTLWAMNWKKPTSVTGRILTEHKRDDSPKPVPIEMSAEMFFPGGVSSSMYCSFITENQQWAVVGGDKGFLNITDFVLPYFGSTLKFHVSRAKFNINICDFNMEKRVQTFAVDEYANSTACAQETNMIRKFSDIALSGKLEPFWPEVALDTQLIMDATIESAHNNGAEVEL
ncbi:MAG: putative dehydrogenase [Pirellulaceae bacterium]|jgi:predicted dehydrogenase